jgi:tetrahydromethanopterin S-methyltransferase subunit C
MRTPLAWFVLLVGVCLIGPYAFGVGPRSRRDWTLVGITVAFLTWLLAGLVSVRS